MTQVDQNQALELIKGSKRIMIAPSSPDGDSIGSALALKLSLAKLGKNVEVVCTEDVPDYLQFLPYTSSIKKEFHSAAGKDFIISLSTANADVDHLKYEVKPGAINIIVTPKNGTFKGEDLQLNNPVDEEIDLIITVDTGDLVQLGKLYEDNKAFFDNTTLLNIDHHASNGRFGTHNFLNFNVAATTQMLTPLIMTLEKEHNQELIDEDIATLLLVGIITDTGSFQHSNTSPEAFEVAADLLERGARQQDIIKHIFKTKSLATLKLWGRVLSKIQYEDHLVYSTITQQDLADTNANSEDSGGIIDELMSNAPNAEVVMLLKEKEKGFVSGSLRAPGDLADVSEIAGELGGGGHKKAAGFRIRNKSMEEALELAKTTIHNYLNKKREAQTASGSEAKEIPQVDTQDAQASAKQQTSTEEQVPTESSDSMRLFPGLVAHPQRTVPKPSPGGEDMLLQDFRKRQDTSSSSSTEKRIQDTSVRFFQDADGQEKTPASPQEKTVGDVLSELSKN